MIPTAALCSGRRAVSTWTVHICSHTCRAHFRRTPLKEEQLCFSFMLDRLDWNQQLQTVITDGWEGGEISLVINPLQMGCAEKNLFLLSRDLMNTHHSTLLLSYTTTKFLWLSVQGWTKDIKASVSIGPSILIDQSTTDHLQQLFWGPENTWV